MRFGEAGLVVTCWLLAACPASPSPSPPDVRDDAAAADQHVEDVQIADRAAREAWRDRAADKAVDAGSVPPQKILITSDDLVMSPTGTIGLHAHYARWATDHILLGYGEFRRISATGQVLAHKAFPANTSGNEPLVVWGIAAGKKGLAVVYQDEPPKQVYLGFLGLDGAFSTGGVPLPVGASVVEYSLMAIPSGFALLYFRTTLTAPNAVWTELQMADQDAQLVGSPIFVGDHGPMTVQPGAPGKASYFTSAAYGLQHVVLDLNPKNPAFSISASLVVTPRDLGRLWHVSTSSATWVGAHDMFIYPNGSNDQVLLYNIEVGGKGVLPDVTPFAKNPNHLTLLADVGTDGRRFLAIWAEEPGFGKFRWRGQVFNDDGTLYGAPQDLALKPSNLYVAGGPPYGLLLWDSTDFIFFYIVQGTSASSSLRMARLSIL